MNKLIIFVIIFFVCAIAYADFNSPFTDFGPNSADQIFTDTGRWPTGGILGASDTTVQNSLQTLSNASNPTSIVQCTTDQDYCFQYSPTTLSLWMSGNQVHDWTIVEAAEFLLLESGDFLLLEDGISKLQLE